MHHEEIDELLDANEAEVVETDISAFSANALKLFNLAGIYKKVRPVIVFARKLLFWKPRFQKVIDDFLVIADGIFEVEA